MKKELVTISNGLEEYYWIRRDLYYKSKELKFNNIPLPADFTEGLCNEIYEMKTADNSTYKYVDSIDKNGNLIEIKSTQQGNSTTTVSKEEKYDFLMWIHFDYDSNTFCIKKYKKEDVDNCINQLSEEGQDKKRPVINLNKISNCILEEKFEFIRKCLIKS